jgi:hypothetical protein
MVPPPATILSMTHMTLIEKPRPDKDAPKIRRFAIVPLPPKYAHLRKTHD